MVFLSINSSRLLAHPSHQPTHPSAHPVSMWEPCASELERKGLSRTIDQSRAEKRRAQRCPYVKRKRRNSNSRISNWTPATSIFAQSHPAKWSYQMEAIEAPSLQVWAIHLPASEFPRHNNPCQSFRCRTVREAVIAWQPNHAKTRFPAHAAQASPARLTSSRLAPMTHPQVRQLASGQVHPGHLLYLTQY